MQIENKKSIFILLFIIISGIIFRLCAMCQSYNLYMNECALALNLFSHSFSELWGPLNNDAVAPPMFLTLNKLLYYLWSFHQTPDFSAILLRLISFLSSIAALPLFAYLLNLIFKNRIIVYIGTFIIAFNPFIIQRSACFKQYSLEVLVTIILLILTLKLDFNKSNKHILKYSLAMGILPFFSLSSLMIIPGTSLYLFIKSVCDKKYKQYGVFLITTLACLLLFYFTYYNPVNSAYEGRMSEIMFSQGHYTNFFVYLHMFIRFVFSPVATDIYNNQLYDFFFMDMLSKYFLFAFIITIIKSFKNSILYITPITIFYLLYQSKMYAMNTRMELFIFPIIIIILLYPLFLLNKFHHFKKLSIAFFILTVFLYGYFKYYKLPLYCYEEHGHDLYKYLMTNYNPKTPIIIGFSKNTGLYYSKVYKIDNYVEDFGRAKYNFDELYAKLPPKTYYYISTIQKEGNLKFIDYVLKNEKVSEAKYFYYNNGTTQVKDFNSSSELDKHYGVFISFRKK